MRRAAALLLLLAALPASADGAPAATSARVTILTPISGLSPFKPAGCGVPGTPTFDSEAEPSLTVDPRDAGNLIAVWQQDRFAIDGGALSNVTAVTHDGGRTWTQVTVPGISRCTGGPDERTSDPWLTFGPDGAAYLASLTFTDNPALAAGGLAGPTNQLVSRSNDGGTTWGPPSTVAANGAYNDREAITADPRRPGVVFETFVDRLGAFGETGLGELSVSRNGGRTFTPPRTTYTAAATNLPDPTLLAVLPDGTLINAFMLANISAIVGPKVPFKVMAMRSTDDGATWSAPVTIAELPPQAPYDSDTNVQVRAFPDVSLAVGPDGHAYIAWNDIASETSSAIRLARSADGGRSWSSPVTVRSLAAQSFLPSVAVDGHGTVGVLWDDLRSHRAGEKTLKTDVWFAGSRDGGQRFTESHVAGPFDAASASSTSSTSVSGRFLGDYQGFVALPSGFAAAFAESGRTQGPSDIFFARIDTAPRAPGAVELTVRPRHAVAGRRTRFTFTATDAVTHRRLPHVLIRFAGRRLRTGRRGTATALLTLRRGAYRAVATATGRRPGRAVVSARRAGR